MTIEAFGVAVTGLSYQPITYRVNATHAGKIREIKEEQVFIPDAGNAERKEVAMKAIAAYEKDGWKGRVSDALNHHMRVSRSENGAIQRVTFIRFVDPTDE